MTIVTWESIQASWWYGCAGLHEIVGGGGYMMGLDKVHPQKYVVYEYFEFIDKDDKLNNV